MIFETFLKSSGIPITVKRGDEPERELRGLLNHEKATKRSYVGFYPGTDIIPGDLLLTPDGDRMHVVDVRTSYFQGKPEELMAYYQTEVEFRTAKNSSTVFNISGNAYGLNVGDGNTTIINCSDSIQNMKEKASGLDAPDKESVERIISLLEMIVNNQIPPSKGLLSKFSDVMERHSWLTSAVSSTLLGWLMTQI